MGRGRLQVLQWRQPQRIKMPNLPVICVFGVSEIRLDSAGPVPYFETTEMDCRCYKDDSDLAQILVRDRPVGIVSFGKDTDFPNLGRAPWFVRRIWLNFEDMSQLDIKGAAVFRCFLHNALARRNDMPLVSVFTGAYKTGDRIHKPLNSLIGQTYGDWEWVIVDDSDDDGETWEMLCGLAEKDCRIRVYRAHRPSGVIGNVKRTACDLARGEYLVELDHDDMLTSKALDLIVRGYDMNPEVGFIYSDCTECQEGGAPWLYGEGWGMGYGSYREEEHGGVKYKVINTPHINAKTIRHIVAAPNHVRSWRSSVYHAIGGHNDLLHVVDDYELLVRTFLNTRMGYIPKMLYVQYRNQTGNTHQLMEREIQRLVRYVSECYDEVIHERFLELGVDDFVWKEGESSFMRLLSVPNPEVEPHCTVTIE